jgi:hypothetical protein
MAVDTEGGSYQIILTHREGENESKPTLNLESYNVLNRPRQVEIFIHRFKILENPTCPCGADQQNVDHIIYE